MVDDFNYSNPNAEVSFLIINVGQDEKVLSFIKEREQSLLSKGYEKIIGLRDMYSEEYMKRSPDEINDGVINTFIDGWNSTIQNMNNPSKIILYIAVMELEAWFLAMYNIYERINPVLNIEYIESELGFDLACIDPQSEFLRPATVVNKILQLVGFQYNKKEHEVEKICSMIDIDDISIILEGGKCRNFKDFYEELLKTIIV